MRENSVAAYAAFVALASFSVGFWVGTRSSSASAPTSTPSSTPSEKDATQASDSDGDESDDSSAGDGDIASVRVDSTDNCKMVLVVRTDLGMSSGKIAAQCSHATLACYKTLFAKNPVMLRQWERDGQTKVALRCDNEDELLLLQAQAQSLNLCARSIQDAGRTQIAAGSRTVLGITGPSRLVNQITGKLRLL